MKDDCGWGTAIIGPIPAIVVGTALLLGVFAVVLVVAARRPDRLTLLVALAVLALAFFVVPTRVHERYGYPFFALAVILVGDLAALAGGLPGVEHRDVREHVRRPRRRSTRTTRRSRTGSGSGRPSAPRRASPIVVLLHLVGFVWVLLQLRPAARRTRLADELDGLVVRARRPPRSTSPPGRGGRAAGATSRSGRLRRRRAAAAMAVAGRAAPPSHVGRRAPRRPPSMPTWSRRPSIGEVGVVGVAARPLVGGAAAAGPLRDADRRRAAVASTGSTCGSSSSSSSPR